jgi:alkanesulfonate monooxygenase SsuD/methylene tetrahydromethanopterin reductase-like flavin-dependent oxidoreductase (luciferase family)
VHYAINIPNFALYADPRLVAELAHEAEEAGWDGFFLWDHISYDVPGSPGAVPVADVWILLAAVALRTTRIKIGPVVTPLPRRRPWKVARESVTLDHLSEGRLILGVGLGNDRSREYSSLGEPTDPKWHGELLDEGLEVVARLWSGEAFSYEGKHYQLTDVRFLPKPVQQPRIPIWVAGFWPNKKPYRRAAQFGGICTLRREHPLEPDDYREILAYMRASRKSDAPFDVIVSGQTESIDPSKDAATMAAFAEAGVTWWQECFDWTHTLDQVRQRIQQGPPQF